MPLSFSSVSSRKMQTSTMIGWDSLSPLTLVFTCPERHLRHLHIAGLCKILQNSSHRSPLTSRIVRSRFCLYVMKRSGGLTGGCVFIERVLLGRSALALWCCILPAMFCFLRSDLWTHKSLWAGIPMVTLAKWLIVGLKAYPLYRLSELFVIQLVSLKGSRHRDGHIVSSSAVSEEN